MKPTTFSNLESILRPITTQLPPKTVVSSYSRGRIKFLEELKYEVPSQSYIPAENLARTLWGIRFRTPIMNAGGMFKNGDCYEMAARQGAGAYLGGTGTSNPRKGNEKNGIYLPFVPYPRSHSASNWLGLPNDGDELNSMRASDIRRIIGMPIGWSVMGSPDFHEKEKLENLVTSMKWYEDAGVDFIEINESCPNTNQRPQEDDLYNRLAYTKENFLDRRSRRLPVIVKFSNDTLVEQLPYVLDLLFKLGYDGVNFGNTSTDYSKFRKKVNMHERRLFDYFTLTFGGGISGRVLKDVSLELSGRSVEYVRKGPPTQEFHVIRTGGIEEQKDLEESERAGIMLNGWFTGYFERFAKYGHDVYRNMFESV